jgi:hypothetical protein
MPLASSVFPILFCTSFKVSHLILKSLIHFDLILIQCNKQGSSFSFLQVDIHFSRQHLESFLHHKFLPPLSKIMWA